MHAHVTLMPMHACTLKRTHTHTLTHHFRYSVMQGEAYNKTNPYSNPDIDLLLFRLAQYITRMRPKTFV